MKGVCNTDAYVCNEGQYRGNHNHYDYERSAYEE